jgi:pyruvate,orthophosphate dikinase
MTDPVSICSLDYLAGTLATAYKGLITSLVARDFCIDEEDGVTTLKGTILSMPEGNYKASLIREGIELSRATVRRGFFELKAESEPVRRGKNLQIDILQNGRHIGTFLLTRAQPDEFFVSALELSEELKRTNLKFLTALVREKPGLFKKAEDIITKILSPKKNWKRFSEEMNSFSKDLFWFRKDAYFDWCETLIRYSLKASEKVDAAVSDKPLSNFLSLIALPLEHEPEGGKVLSLVNIWLRELKDSSVDLSYRFTEVEKVIAAIRDRFPGAGVDTVLRTLILSLRSRLLKAPAIKEDILDPIRGFIPEEDLDILGRYTEKKRKELLINIAEAESMVCEKDYALVFEKIRATKSFLSDDAEIINAFFAAIVKNLTERSAETLSEAVFKVFPIFGELSPHGRETIISSTAALLRKLADLSMIGICEKLLVYIEVENFLQKEEIVLNPGVAASVLFAGDEKLLGHYKKILKGIVIPAPKVIGFSNETWAEIVNPLHLERLSKFLGIIRLDSTAFKDVLIHVICNLSITGVFMPDDKLFQREISAYLNSDTLRDNFLLHCMLLQKLPAYYNEIGASGRIRDYTTDIDSWGDDPVLYFLRKQIHVNASNHNMQLVERIINSWVLKNPDILEGSVPEEVFERLNSGLFAEYSAAMRALLESIGTLKGGVLLIEKILSISETDLDLKTKKLDASEEVRSKVFLLCRIYQEVAKKYSLACAQVETVDINEELFRSASEIKDFYEIVASPEKTLAEESLYFKRHIAFGIPSVIGSYREPKFDAFGLMIRKKEKVRVIFEAIISSIEEKTKDFSTVDAKSWIRGLDALAVLFDIHGLGNFQVDELLAIFRTNRLHLSQVIDMLRIWQKELTTIVEFLQGAFQQPLSDILKIFPDKELPEHLKRLDPRSSGFIPKAADVIIRGVLNSVAGLTELDRILAGLIEVFRIRVESVSDEEFTLSDQPEKDGVYFLLDELSDVDAMRLGPAIGGKAKNLVYLGNRGLAVPFGVAFSSQWTRNYRKYTESPAFEFSLEKAVEHIENRTGAVFGGLKTPLFLSVRSGSYISMPGILHSILYCGMNDDTLEAFIEDTGNPSLAWDSYMRFIEHFSTTVYNIEASFFEDISAGLMRDIGRSNPGPKDLEKIVRLYKQELNARGLKIPDDVYVQLRESVRAVYASWFEEKAVYFRKAMDVSEHWGTSVLLMEMVFGNATGSGASVFFTRIPVSLGKGIYGDTREQATGVDIVSGAYVNSPLSKLQSLEGAKSLEETDPELFSMHGKLAELIERAMGGLPQEVEVTYTRRLQGERAIYVLQTRRMESHRGFTKRFDDVCRMRSKVIGRGVGVHGGALSGIATFSSSPAHIRKLREEFDLPVILLRKMADTSDVSLMPEIDGIIASAGGVASHASVLAQKFNLTAVVGCSDLDIRTDAKGESYAVIGNYTVMEGTALSMDGSTGLVYSGLCTFKRTGIS